MIKFLHVYNIITFPQSEKVFIFLLNKLLDLYNLKDSLLDIVCHFLLFNLTSLRTCRSNWRHPASTPAWRSQSCPRCSSRRRSSAAACSSHRSRVQCCCGWSCPSPSWSCRKRIPASPSVPGWHLKRKEKSLL